MAYVVLARKWRPQTFSDLVGQEHVARTLGNAIASDRVAHAFLFTGVRGVGKTTSARILAKALNCMGRPGEPPLTGPTTKPCLECPACIEITQGTDVDVLEIDGASYTGVDDVRKLQQSLPYRPNRDRYKVVIVDEVHMLSMNAWNAFLKTLEEPPAHVKFIFATTEVHKVPATILSRVQRFDFKLIAPAVMAERLRFVLAAEHIEADAPSLSLITREAAGSMRDAMSLLDQVIAWGGERLTGSEVARVLGVASQDALCRLVAALLQGRADECLALVGQLADESFDMAHVARDTLALLRDLVVAKVCRDPATALELPEQERAEVIALAAGASAEELVRLHRGLAQSFDEVARGGQPRMAFEMLLVRLATRPPLAPLGELVDRLTALERRLAGAGHAARPATTAPHATSAPARPAERGPGHAVARGARPPSAAEDADEPPPAGAPAQHLAPSPVSTAPERVASPEPRAVDPARVMAPERTARAATTPGEAGGHTRPEFPSRSPSAQSAATGRTPNATPTSEAPRRAEPWTEEQLAARKAWSAVAAAVDAAAFPDLGALLEQGVPLALSERALAVGFLRGSVFEGRLNQPTVRAELARAVAATLDSALALELAFNLGPERRHETLSAERLAERAAREQAALAAARSHPAVQLAAELLGARIESVRLLREP